MYDDCCKHTCFWYRILRLSMLQKRLLQCCSTGSFICPFLFFGEKKAAPKKRTPEGRSPPDSPEGGGIPLAPPLTAGRVVTRKLSIFDTILYTCTCDLAFAAPVGANRHSLVTRIPSTATQTAGWESGHTVTSVLQAAQVEWEQLSLSPLPAPTQAVRGEMEPSSFASE